MRKDRITASQRRAVTERAENCCEYCLSQLRFSMQSFSVEHIIPADKGGKTEPENPALSCQRCNNHKYTGFTLIFKTLIQSSFKNAAVPIWRSFIFMSS
ncbi:MAG TPA: hypothetical protein DCQ37_01285 [Desulfobacteraceae bacterium]|nr:hypothetical protein [Desulfobacteraceae bacterium]